MSIQPSSFNPLFAQQSGFSPTINTFDSGNVFDGHGNDFLSPKNILGNVDSFSHSISFGGDFLGVNPSPRAVLNNTNATVSQIFSSNFGINLTAPIAPAPNTFSTAGFPPFAVANNTTVFQQAVQTPSPALIRDLSNFNPLIWQNPNPDNIILGTMDAQNKIFGGPGLFQPQSFNQYPLYPFIAPPSPPYTGYTIPIPSQNNIHTFQQAELFPTTFNTGSPFYNTTFQPYAVATSQTLFSYPQQVALASWLQTQSGALSSQLMGSLSPINQQVYSSPSPVYSSNIPAWM